jgi:hypothetical protein
LRRYIKAHNAELERRLAVLEDAVVRSKGRAWHTLPRHVIDTHLEHSVIESRGINEAVRNICWVHCPPRHGPPTRIMNPRFLIYMASYDVAIDIRRTLNPKS